MMVIKNFLYKEFSILPLVVFRIIFGLLLFIAIARFWWMGWINSTLIEPDFHFTYYGFQFIKPLPALGMYLLFAAILLSCIFILLGLFYRLSMLFFFLAFTYVELIDKTLYLNHYYFVSLLSFSLIFIPLHHNFSIDSQWIFKRIKRLSVPFLFIFIIQLQLGIVYFFAGVAKLNSDWLLHAQPLTIWLNSKTDVWLLGPIFEWQFSAFLMSWIGALFDLSIVFFLWYKRSRGLAYIILCFFHLITGYLFNIGMFPFIMMGCSLIFFSPLFLKRIFPIPINLNINTSVLASKNMLCYLFLPLFGFQILFPLRHHLYPGNVLWTEEGFRFSWMVLLVEKTAFIEYYLENEQGQSRIIYPKDYLTKFQYTEMSYQPDMILEFAHFLEKKFRTNKEEDLKVYVDCFVSLNGRPHKRLIKKEVDLSKIKDGWQPYSWILR